MVFLQPWFLGCGARRRDLGAFVSTNVVDDDDHHHNHQQKSDHRDRSSPPRSDNARPPSSRRRTTTTPWCVDRTPGGRATDRLTGRDETDKAQQTKTNRVLREQTEEEEARARAERAVTKSKTKEQTKGDTKL